MYRHATYSLPGHANRWRNRQRPVHDVRYRARRAGPRGGPAAARRGGGAAGWRAGHPAVEKPRRRASRGRDRDGCGPRPGGH